MLLLETCYKTDQKDAINAKVCATKWHRKYFAKNAPDPPHWTLSSCFGPFCHLHETWCKTGQPDAINAKVHATPLDPKLMFWCVSFRLGAFGTVSLVHKTCCKTRQTGAIKAKVRAMMSCYNFYNEHSRSTPLDPKLMFWCVSFRSGAFWTVSLLHETWCKTRQTGAINAKVCATMSC